MKKSILGRSLVKDSDQEAIQNELEELRAKNRALLKQNIAFECAAEDADARLKREVAKVKEFEKRDRREFEEKTADSLSGQIQTNWDKLSEDLRAGGAANARGSSIIITPDMHAFRAAQQEVVRLKGALDTAYEDNVALRKKIKADKPTAAKEEIPGWWQCSPEFVKKAMEDFVPPSDGK